MSMESLTERAIRLIEPVLGTKESPTLGPINYSEGLRIAVIEMLEEGGTRGLGKCERRTSEPDCGTCTIIGHRICDLVRTELVFPIVDAPEPQADMPKQCMSFVR